VDTIMRAVDIGVSGFYQSVSSPILDAPPRYEGEVAMPPTARRLAATCAAIVFDAQGNYYLSGSHQNPDPDAGGWQSGSAIMKS
jgi:hypothetical protein